MPSSGRPADPQNRRPAHLQLLAISWNFGWPVAAGVVVGHWIDEAVGTSPAATLVLGVGAMAAAVWRLLVLSREEQAERRRGEDEEREGER
ncbi:MAG: AtpZ/AtpI family protein [Candidatus Binatia bacterium]